MNTKELCSFYQNRIVSHEALLQQTKRQIYWVGSFRLALVLLTALAVYLVWGKGPVVLGVLLAGVAALLYLIKWHNKLFAKRDYHAVNIQVAREEILAIDYDFSSFDGAKERVDASHTFSLDIDLFGNRSLFQSLNRTVTPTGKDTLAAWLEEPLREKDAIEARQQAVAELKSQAELRLNFRIAGLLYQGERLSPDELKRFVEEPDFLLAGKTLWTALSWLYPLFWLAAISLVSFSVWPPSIIGVGIVLLYAFSESKTKKIDRIQRSLEKKMKVFASYAELIRQIEENEPESADLKAIKAKLINDGHRVSGLINDLAGLLSNLDLRTSGFGRFLLNTLLLWDIRYALKIESWKARHGKELGQWMSAIGEFDALCSLGTFAFNNDSYVFPEVSERYFCLEAKSLGHPMMRREVCVKNDISIGKHPFFLIITGANMAGKSTYLRTVAVNYLLASAGAPVCADSFRFYPARLVTSLRTSDSLNDNESYFFAELKRLKMIIDRLKQGEQLFIILDEILKGTNSVDKQKGSIALMKQLIGMNACGIIATHDLALGSLINDFPGNISNHRFEADIRENELSFSYSMQDGVAENMNACFLMNKMGITVG